MFAFSTLSNVSALRRVRLEEVAVVCLPQIRQPHVYQIPHLDAVSASYPDHIMSESTEGISKFMPAFFRDCDDERATLLPKQGNISPSSVMAGLHAPGRVLLVLDSQTASQRHLGDSDDLAAAGDVMHRIHKPGFNQTRAPDPQSPSRRPGLVRAVFP